MIDLTIKTLDSQNHAFSVDDDITVAQFKEKIAEVINIPVESQRLIYCGRVLQDAKKLQEYDVNGKVVHLVQRAPPSATRRSRSPIMTGNNRRPFTNAMYLGSMAFPTGLMEAQGMVRPPPTQSLSGSRLAVARRMIRRAENILNNLEGGTRSRESPPEEAQDDVTPVFAAQVIVPHTSNDDALAASLSAAVSAVENGILQAEQSMQAEPIPMPMPMPTGSSATEPEPSATITPEQVEAAATATSTDTAASAVAAAATATPSSSSSATPSSSSSASASADSNNGRSRTRGLPRNSYGTIEMSRLLDDLNKIHERLQPYMVRYHTFMRTDPVVSGEQETRDTQQMINRVSEIMHLLGHAYHSLSDVMVQVSTPAPRPLLCRPILIQHSAVVQAGIPIQVEAQINLTPDRRPSDSNSSATGVQTQNETHGAATNTNTNGSGGGATSATAAQQPNVHEIRIDSFPFEFRGFQRHPMFNISTAQGRSQGQAQTQAQMQSATANQGQAQSQTQGQGQAQQNENQAAPPPTGNNDSGSQATETNTNANAPAGQQREPFVAVVPPFSNNPNMEFFMEVTPESITIDSLETTVVTSAAQADNVLRGTFGGVPPEFIQSLVLHAIGGEVMGTAGGTPNQNGNATVGNIATFEFPANATVNDNSAASETNQSGASTANTAANGTNVNSQARGNTQTHPTTSTQTRSTARPHEHLAQHNMQGFDPFLPCNSHHIHRRRTSVTAATVMSATATASGAENNANAGTEQQNNNQVPNPIYNILQGLLRSLGNTNLPHQARERNEQEDAASAATTTGTTAAPTAPPPTSQPPSDPDTISLTLDFADLTRMLFDNRSLGQSTTLASVLQNFPDHQYTEGDSLFTDLVMTLARGLTFSDVIALNTGHIDPLVRIRPTLRTFFRNRVLEGECPTQEAIDRGANRLITELQPILELMSTMRVRNNIDIVESATQLCRTRFPNIISLLMSRMTGSLRSLVDLCLLTIRQLCALALHSCEDGQAGVEEVFRALIARYTVGVSPDIHQWTITTSLTQIRHFLRTLDVSPASIEPYIVMKSTDAASTPTSIAEPEGIEPEAMECDEAPIVETVAEPPAEPTNLNAVRIIEDESDPLPNVVIGSEPWHCGLQTDWIPIITRDNQRQRRQNPQAPFSDAYLSGMPSKRRKIVASAKPQGNLSQVISDGVRRAVTASGLTNAVPLDVVSQAASADLTLQSAYRDLLRTSVQSELRDNPDFTSERFPNAANYFNINK